MLHGALIYSISDLSWCVVSRFLSLADMVEFACSPFHILCHGVQVSIKLMSDRAWLRIIKNRHEGNQDLVFWNRRGITQALKWKTLRYDLWLKGHRLSWLMKQCCPKAIDPKLQKDAIPTGVCSLLQASLWSKWPKTNTDILSSSQPAAIKRSTIVPVPV